MEFKYPSKQQIIHKYKPIISLHTFVKRQKRSKNSLHIRTPAIQPGTLSFQLHKGWIWMKKTIWVFPKIVVPQNGWFIRENPIKMDDLRVPLFLETPISNQLEFSGHYFLEGKKIKFLKYQSLLFSVKGSPYHHSPTILPTSPCKA